VNSRPTTPDEEILSSPQSSAVPTVFTDEQRLRRIDGELQHGFDALHGLGCAVTVFGSARRARRATRRTTRWRGRSRGGWARRATRSSPAAAAVRWRPPTAVRATPA
jgi:hypothetical protein